MKNRIKAGIVVVYWAQVVLFVAMLLGDISRSEASHWITVACQKAYHRFGFANALLCAYMYLIYYSSLLTIPYYLFRLVFQKNNAEHILWSLLSFWTLMMFMEPLLHTMHGMGEWLLLLWALSILIVIVVTYLRSVGRRPPQ